MTLGEEGKRMIVYDAKSGRVKWNKELVYTDPPILHGDRILAGGRGFVLLTGDTVMRDDPLTGKQIPWSYARSYGCNYPVAAENLLTFRSAAAGFYDLVNEGGVGNFGGFKSSCSSNLVAADGRAQRARLHANLHLFLSKPNLALRSSTCPNSKCGLATTTPIAAARSIASASISAAQAIAVRATARSGSNIPSRVAPSPKVPIELTGTVKYFHQNSGRIEGSKMPWVAASGVEGEATIRVTLNRDGDPTLEEGLPIASSADDAEEDRARESPARQLRLGTRHRQGSARLSALRFSELSIPPARRSHPLISNSVPKKIMIARPIW